MDKIEKIAWTEDAISSFEDVVKYISEDSVYYASNFAKKILMLVENLKDFFHRQNRARIQQSRNQRAHLSEL